jgi:hypothetical protein
MYEFEEEGPRRIVLNLSKSCNKLENGYEEEEHLELEKGHPKPIRLESKPKVYQFISAADNEKVEIVKSSQPIPFAKVYQIKGKPSDTPASTTHDEETLKDNQIKKQAKLATLPGTEAPLDVPLSEIQTRGLEALLLSKVPLAYFLTSCMREHANENIFFLLECEHYVSSDFESSEQQERAAKRIIETYIDEIGNFQV